jgi:integrase
MAHRQQGSIVRRTYRLKDGTEQRSPNYTILYRVGPTLKKEVVGPSKKVAARVLADRLKALHDGTYREVREITFTAYAEQWERARSNVKPSTLRGYQSMIATHLVPAFGERPLRSIGPSEINRYLADQQDRVRPKTRRNVLTLLHKMLRDAIAQGYLTVNPVKDDSVERPKAMKEGDEREVEVLQPTEVNRLLDAVRALDGENETEAYPLFLTAVLTGMRLGELLALQWGDVDWEGHQIRVRRSCYKGAFYVPKSKRSHRRVDVGDQLLDVLRGVRQRRYADGQTPADALCFPNAEGKPLDGDNLRHRVWEPALAKAELPHYVMHSLRHFYASALISQGEDLKYVSQQLGHASISITVDRYGHVLKGERRAARRLEERLGLTIAGNTLVTIPAEPVETSPNEPA